MPIRIRLALLYAIGTGAVLAGAGLGFAHALSDGLRGSMVATLRVQANAITQAMARSTAGSSDTATAEDGTGTRLAGPSRPSGVPPAVVAAMTTATADVGLSQVIGPAGIPVAAAGRAPSPPLLDQGQLTAARRGKWLGERRFPGAAAPDLLLAQPIPDWPGAVVVVGASLATVDEATSRIHTALAIGGPITVTLAGLGAWLLAGAALSPVTRMREQAATIAETDADMVLPVPDTRDEVAALARTLNALLLRLRSALGRQRGFIAAASHELRTPLAALRAELELADEPGGSGPRLRAALRAASADADRLVRLAENLLLLARSDEGEPVVALSMRDLAPVLNRCAEAFTAAAGRVGVTIDVGIAPGLRAEVDDLRFRQVLDNLVANALRFAPPGSVVRITGRAEGPLVVIEVADEGPGFPPRFLPQALERFSRGDDGSSRRDGGAGLGLAIVKALVEAHGGRVELGNAPTAGAWVRISLPTLGTDP